MARLYLKKLSMTKRSPDATRWEVAGRNKRFAAHGGPNVSSGNIILGNIVGNAIKQTGALPDSKHDQPFLAASIERVTKSDHATMAQDERNKTAEHH